MGERPERVGFVSLRSLKKGAPDAASALAEIRRIYFRTTARTIDADLAHAIDLLTSLPTDEEREKATVFMEGLAQMRREWGTAARTADRRRRPAGESGSAGSRPRAKTAGGSRNRKR